MSSMEDEMEQPPEGEDFQAVLPPLRTRPARIPADEQAWLRPPIMTGTLPSPLTPPCPAFLAEAHAGQLAVFLFTTMHAAPYGSLAL